MTEERRSPQWYRSSEGKVDLNDPKTYQGWFAEHMTLDAHGLRNKIQNEVGFSLYYMTCIYPEWDRAQYNRVLAFGNYFAREVREPDRWENVAWLRKQLFLILDETENQC